MPALILQKMLLTILKDRHIVVFRVLLAHYFKQCQVFVNVSFKLFRLEGFLCATKESRVDLQGVIMPHKDGPYSH